MSRFRTPDPLRQGSTATAGGETVQHILAEGEVLAGTAHTERQKHTAESPEREVQIQDQLDQMREVKANVVPVVTPPTSLQQSPCATSAVLRNSQEASWFDFLIMRSDVSPAGPAHNI